MGYSGYDFVGLKGLILKENMVVGKNIKFQYLRKIQKEQNGVTSPFYIHLQVSVLTNSNPTTR